MSNNFGDCGDITNRLCEGNEVFLNQLEERRANTISIVETVVSYQGKDNDNIKSSVASKILSFSIKQ